MSHRAGNTRGKWLAGSIVAIGLVAALVALKFRKLPQRPPPQAQPPATTPVDPA